MSSLLTLNYFTPFPKFLLLALNKQMLAGKITRHSIRLTSVLMCPLEEGRTEQEAM